MNILFVHQNFPGQFRHLAPALHGRGHRVLAIGLRDNEPLAGIETHRYSLTRGNAPGIHPFAREFESKVLRGEACARQALTLRDRGFTPDLVIAHPGWGEALYLKDVFPRARLLIQSEFFYRPEGQDLGFDPEFPAPDLDTLARLKTKNANLLLALEAMDLGLTPTQWQASTHPAWIRDRLRVIHEGIDTERIRPNPKAELSLPDQGVRVRPGDEVLTFAARNLEPVRGYHRFMRALPEILARRPNLRVFIVGGDGHSYGPPPPTGSYRQHYLDEVAGRLDPKRVFIMNRLPHGALLQLFQITRCHVYLTYPFVLSWSMLEAMSAGALVVGSRTPPVEEVIRDGENGRLVDFFDRQALVDTVCEALARPEAQRPLREQARRTIIERYDLNTLCLPAQWRLIEDSLS